MKKNDSNDIAIGKSINNVGDLISRQTLIKDAESWTAVDECERHLQKNVIKWLKEFPSAEHGTNLAEVGADLIGRQAAIDALEKDMASIDQIIKGMSAMDVRLDAYVSQRNQVVYDIDAIKQLPAIQPKRGKWIKTARWGRVYYCNQCRNYLDFDGVNAGRGSTNFCPNCGAKMDGTE